MPKTCVLAGSASRHLAEGIARVNSLHLLENKVVRFVNNELKVTLPEGIENFEHCIIVQTAANPANDNLMETFLMADTLKREGIKHIDAIIPYYGYSRQDKQHLPRECVSMEVTSKILKSVGVDRIFTCDIHNEKVIENLTVPIINTTVMSNIAKQIYKNLNLDEATESEFTIASPDQGGIERAEIFAKNFYRNQENLKVVSIKKERELDKQHLSKAIELSGEIENKNLIIVDDVSTSGGTLLNALKLCQANGVKNAYACVVHADFGPGVPEKIRNSDFLKVYTTNTIEKTIENLSYYRKINVLDVSDVFGGFVEV